MTDGSSRNARVAPDDLRRQLGLWDAVAIFVGIILGSGIFVAPAAVSGAAPGRLSSVGVWLVGGLVAACGAFCYAECGARLPKQMCCVRGHANQAGSKLRDPPRGRRGC